MFVLLVVIAAHALVALLLLKFLRPWALGREKSSSAPHGDGAMLLAGFAQVLGYVVTASGVLIAIGLILFELGVY